MWVWNTQLSKKSLIFTVFFFNYFWMASIFSCTLIQLQSKSLRTDVAIGVFSCLFFSIFVRWHTLLTEILSYLLSEISLVLKLAINNIWLPLSDFSPYTYYPDQFFSLYFIYLFLCSICVFCNLIWSYCFY